MDIDETIESFTFDDFAKTTKPFDIIAEETSGFRRSQIKELVAKRAKAVGYTGFKQQYDLYAREKRGESEPEQTMNKTDFIGMPIENQLSCGSYICNSDGVYIADRNGPKPICLHPIAPVKRYKNIETGEELLEIWFSRGSAWNRKTETRVVSKETVSKDILALAKYGVAVTKANATDLSTFLINMEQWNIDVLEEQASTTRLGWVRDDFEEFSPYMERIHFDGLEEFGSIFNSVGTKGSFDKWVEEIKKVRSEKTVARYFIASSFASVILKPCDLLPFIVHIWGGTGNGKSVLLMIAASVWANPDPGEFTSTFNGTRYAQETKAGFINSLPLCLDELQIQASQGVANFDDIIYQLCEGVSKAQGKATGGLRTQQKWRNVILSNGEHSILKPLSGGGARNRVIEIEAVNKVYSDLVGICRIIKANYGHAGQKFVEWLMAPANMELVKEMQQDFYHELVSPKRNISEKQAGSASAILTADKVITDLFFKDGNAITPDEIEQILLKVDDVNQNKSFLEFVYDHIAANLVHFDADHANVEVWGKIDEDDNSVYFIKSIFDRELKQHGADSKAFLSWAVRQNLIVAGEKMRGVVKRIKRDQKSCVVRVVIIKPRSDGDEQNDDEQTELPF